MHARQKPFYRLVKQETEQYASDSTTTPWAHSESSKRHHSFDEASNPRDKRMRISQVLSNVNEILQDVDQNDVFNVCLQVASLLDP